MIDTKRNLKLLITFIGKHKLLAGSILFATLIAEIAVMYENVIFKQVIDAAEQTSARQVFIALAIQLLLLYGVLRLINAAMAYVRFHSVNQMESRVLRDVENTFFKHIVDLSYRFHLDRKTGSLISQLTRGVRGTEAVMDSFIFNFVPTMLKVGLALMLVVYFDFWSAIAVGTMALVFIGYSLSLMKFRKKYQSEENDADDAVKDTISDGFMNIDTIKCFGKERAVTSNFKKKTLHLKKKRLLHWNLFRKEVTVQNIVIGAGFFAVLAMGLRSFSAGAITIGTLALLLTATTRIVEPLWSFTHGVRQLYFGLVDMNSLYGYFFVRQEIRDSAEATKLRVTRGHVEFKDVIFKYDNRNILNRLHLKLEGGKKTALVGASGCGKSTLVRLLYRFFDIQQGCVEIDGQDVRKVTQESLRQQISIVPQESMLFNSSLYDNVAFARTSASYDEVMTAMHHARLDDLLDRLPEKEKTVVGERGVKLSGGEKQRVAIARAFLADRPIIVLDEATSALDSHTEHEIQCALHDLLEGRTAIIIAHRLSTIMDCDNIVVMEKGKVIEQGTHDELCKNGKLYHKLWKLQSGGYL